jgi:hypothetical protein
MAGARWLRRRVLDSMEVASSLDLCDLQNEIIHYCCDY